MADEGALWFVDIKQRLIHRFHEATGERRSWPAPQQVSFIAPARGGGFVVGLKTGLHLFDPVIGEFSLLAVVEPDRPGNRLNDGHVDARGRLWFGSMDDGETAATGRLYCYDRGDITARDNGYVITNGPATSPDGRTLYHVDTRLRTIYAFDLDEAGQLSGKRVFARIETPGANPDGPTVDAAGDLWIGLYAGWGVQRFSPDGRLLETLQVPAPNVTKVTFGGPDLKTLYITTARHLLPPEAVQAAPLAGGLFAVRVEAAGQPQSCVNLR